MMTVFRLSEDDLQESIQYGKDGKSFFLDLDSIGVNPAKLHNGDIKIKNTIIDIVQCDSTGDFELQIKVIRERD